MTGSCLCGAVTYELTGTFMVVGNCHCPTCRKANGAAFVTWGIIGPDQFRWTSGAELVQGFESSPGRRRCFCKQCGASLACEHDGDVSEVVLASLDDDPGTSPSEHIFVGCKASWHVITDALPQFEGWPPGISHTFSAPNILEAGEGS